MEADELPPEILAERQRTQEEWRWCNEFLATPTVNFREWLDRNTIDEVPLRTEKRGTIYSRLRNKNLLPAWETYKQQTRAQWRKWPESKRRKDNSPGRFSPAVQKEMLWRLAESKLLFVSAEVESLREQVLAVTVEGDSSEEMKFLPKEMQWVAGHPLLAVTLEQENRDPALKALSKEYAKKCPNQMAVNWFNTLRGDAKALVDFWKQVQTKWSEEVKRTDKKPDSDADEEGQENLDHAKNLAEMLGVKV
jgi:hypothetical protein